MNNELHRCEVNMDLCTHHASTVQPATTASKRADPVKVMIVARIFVAV